MEHLEFADKTHTYEVVFPAIFITLFALLVICIIWALVVCTYKCRKTGKQENRKADEEEKNETVEEEKNEAAEEEKERKESDNDKTMENQTATEESFGTLAAESDDEKKEEEATSTAANYCDNQLSTPTSGDQGDGKVHTEPCVEADNVERKESEAKTNAIPLVIDYEDDFSSIPSKIKIVPVLMEDSSDEESEESFTSSPSASPSMKTTVTGTNIADEQLLAEETDRAEDATETEAAETVINIEQETVINMTDDKEETYCSSITEVIQKMQEIQASLKMSEPSWSEGSSDNSTWSNEFPSNAASTMETIVNIDNSNEESITKLSEASCSESASKNSSMPTEFPSNAEASTSNETKTEVPKKQKLFKCRICNKSCQNEGGLRDHMNKKHKETGSATSTNDVITVRVPPGLADQKINIQVSTKKRGNQKVEVTGSKSREKVNFNSHADRNHQSRQSFKKPPTNYNFQQPIFQPLMASTGRFQESLPLRHDNFRRGQSFKYPNPSNMHNNQSNFGSNNGNRERNGNFYRTGSVKYHKQNNYPGHPQRNMTHPQSSIPKPFTCRVCYYSFPTHQQLSQHLTMVHHHNSFSNMY